MRQNTLSVIGQQVRAHTPPDHAGVAYDDGDASARTCFSCWAVFYDGGGNESRGGINCSAYPYIYLINPPHYRPPRKGLQKFLSCELIRLDN